MFQESLQLVVVYLVLTVGTTCAHSSVSSEVLAHIVSPPVTDSCFPEEDLGLLSTKALHIPRNAPARDIVCLRVELPFRNVAVVGRVLGSITTSPAGVCVVP